MSGTIHDVVYDTVVPMIQESSNPGMATRVWLQTENFTSEELIEVCVALAITVRNESDRHVT